MKLKEALKDVCGYCGSEMKPLSANTAQCSNPNCYGPQKNRSLPPKLSDADRVKRAQDKMSARNKKLGEALPSMEHHGSDRRQPQKTFPKKTSLDGKVAHLEQRLIAVEKTLEQFMANLSKMTHSIDDEIKKDIEG